MKQNRPADEVALVASATYILGTFIAAGILSAILPDSFFEFFGYESQGTEEWFCIFLMLFSAVAIMIWVSRKAKVRAVHRMSSFGYGLKTKKDKKLHYTIHNPHWM